MQGKLFQRCTHFLYCSVLLLSGNVNTRRMSKPYMGSIFHINNQWNILVIGNYYVNYQNYQNSMPLPPRILNEHWGIYSCLQIPPRENRFQYVHRVYPTAINFPSITFLVYSNFLVLLITTVCSQNINKQIVNIADETLTDYSFFSGYH